VTLRICARSGLREGKYCREVSPRTFLERDAPDEQCTACKAPEPEHVNRVAEAIDAELKDSAPLEYPDELREEGISGSVTVGYTVSEKGRVTNVKVIRSSGHDALDDAAMRTLRKYRYRPAQQDGQPRAVQKTITFTFRLSD
jgi:TonB family protein